MANSESPSRDALGVLPAAIVIAEVNDLPCSVLTQQLGVAGPQRCLVNHRCGRSKGVAK